MYSDRFILSSSVKHQFVYTSKKLEYVFFITSNIDEFESVRSFCFFIIVVLFCYPAQDIYLVRDSLLFAYIVKSYCICSCVAIPIRSFRYSNPFRFGTPILYARKAGATIEDLITNARHAIGDSDARKALATIEALRSNACYTIGDSDACKASAILKGLIANICYVIRNCYAQKVFATIEGALTDRRQLAIFAKADTLKVTAIIEGSFTDTCHAIRKGDTRNVVKIMKGIIFDAGHSGRNHKFFDKLTIYVKV